MLIDPQLSEAISEFEKPLRNLALRLEGRNGAEVDDLVQEGRLSLWGPLAKGTVPSLDVCFLRMKQWVRHLQPQNPMPWAEIEHGG